MLTILLLISLLKTKSNFDYFYLILLAKILAIRFKSQPFSSKIDRIKLI